MRGLSKERNCIRFVYPRLACWEGKVPCKDYRRVDNFEEPPRSEIGGKDTFS